MYFDCCVLQYIVCTNILDYTQFHIAQYDASSPTALFETTNLVARSQRNTFKKCIKGTLAYKQGRVLTLNGF